MFGDRKILASPCFGRRSRGEQYARASGQELTLNKEAAQGARCAVRFGGARWSLRGHRRPASPGRSKWHCHPSCSSIPLRRVCGRQGWPAVGSGAPRGRHAARRMRLRIIVRCGRHAGSGHSGHPGPAGGCAQLPAHGKWGSEGLQDGERAGSCTGKLGGYRRLRAQTSSQRFAYILPPPATTAYPGYGLRPLIHPLR
jgi:hypothetical protein